MMKRDINTLLWPYFSVTMYDKIMKVCIGCKGILCGEREDMYRFLVIFFGKCAPGHPLSDVLAFSSDVFLIK